jgi:RHS repeat-associated protein
MTANAMDRAVRGTLPASAWPAAGRATVDLPAGTGLSPAAPAANGSGGHPAGAVHASSLPVWASAGASTHAAGPGSAGTAAPSRLTVEVLDRSQSDRARLPGVLLRVQRADGAAAPAAVGLSVDYSSFRNLFGADWSSRLRLQSVPECALTDPTAAGCRATDLPSANDVRHRTVTAQLTVSGASKAPTGATTSTATSSGQVSLLALTSGTSGSAGDFSASSLAPSGTWQESGFTGGFAWSYPLRVPPALGGPSPHLSLAYSSQSVDGRTAASNNQPSWVGEGFEMWSGFVERRYKACADDMGGGATNTTKTGDLCWGTDNATLSLNGNAVELIKDGSGLWHPVHDDGSRIERRTDTVNGDNDSESWKVTTVDGTQYFFGLNRISGWTQGKPETNSTWTVPVFGNNAGEPCFNSVFDNAWCNQAWRWNLDYVIDPHGNTMSFWYTPETNNYGRDLSSIKVSSYVRGGVLNRVDYGTRSDAEFGYPPSRVTFGVADRCSTAPCDSAHPANWPDVPWDQSCSASPCTNVLTPTFWSTKRLSSITTQVWNGSAYSDVDTWTLNQIFKDPGDGTRAGLWLAGISHTGKVGTAVSVPDVTFDGVQMNNRVDTASDNLAAMNWWRIGTITTETGGRIQLTYMPPGCSAPSNMPGSPDTNTMRCFPVYWTPPGATAPKLDWFHKYLVTDVTEHDLTGLAPRVITHYDYVGPAAWHYDDDDGLVPPSRKTWGQWRGYGKVVVTRGDGGTQTVNQYTYFRGMNGDKLPPGSRSIQVVDSAGGSVPDDDALAGMVREHILYNGNDVVENTINDAYQSAPTASRTITTTVSSLFTGIARSRTRTVLDNGRQPRYTSYSNTFDSYGMVVQTDDQGDEATTNDDACVRTTYQRNTTGWLMSYPSRVERDALACGTAPSSLDDVISDTRTSYDNAAFGTAPTKGDPTRVEKLSDWPSSGRTYVTTGRAGFDPNGRTTDTYDGNNNHYTNAYTPATGGPVTQVVTTNPLGQRVTTTLEPAWGQPTATVDANGKRTDVSYDGLGRLTNAWLPGHVKDTDPASEKYTYLIRNSGVVALTTQSLKADGQTYTTSEKLYDALLRPRQTQDQAPGGGRIITDTFYNTAGQVATEYGAYYNNGAPSQDLFVPTSFTLVPTQTATTYDGAGRVTASIFRPFGTPRWQTTKVYHGDRVDVTPPTGGAVTSTVVDGRGRTVELRTYQAPTPTGSYDTEAHDSTTYAYDRKGELATMTDPAGGVWTYEYDVRGRWTSITDPDQGTTTAAYDNGDRLVSTTDGRNQTLVYTYDEVDRKTGVYKDSITPTTQLAGWTHDKLANGTVVNGQLASSTRYVNGSAYVTAVTGYNDRYQPTGMSITIPSTETAFAGSYAYTLRYNNGNGSLASVQSPKVADLPAELVRYGYSTDVNLPTTLRGLTSYVTLTEYTPIKQLQRFTLSNGGPYAYQTYEYESATNRLSRSYVEGEVANPYRPQDKRYTYDSAGNITKIADTPSAGSSDNQCFGYDYLRRLTDAWTPSSGDCTTAPVQSAVGGAAPYWLSWTYDSIGDRRTQVEHGTGNGDLTTTYNYPATGAARPHAVQSITVSDNTGSRTSTYAYDAAGNTTSRPGATGGQTLTWDPQGVLSSVTEGSSTTSFLNDADGNRLIRSDANGSTLYLPDMEVRKVKSTGQLVATRYYTIGGRQVAMRTSAGVNWLFTDHQGTTNLAMNATDQSVLIRRQTPFGTPRGSVPSWPTEKGFVGGTTDPTGLTHLGARDYDPTIGRFISVDPLVDKLDPQQMEGYSYADNSPVTASDPDGRMTMCADSCGEPGNSVGPPPSATNANDPGKQRGGGSGRGGSGGGGGLGGLINLARGKVQPMLNRARQGFGLQVQLPPIPWPKPQPPRPPSDDNPPPHGLVMLVTAVNALSRMARVPNVDLPKPKLSSYRPGYIAVGAGASVFGVELGVSATVSRAGNIRVGGGIPIFQKKPEPEDIDDAVEALKTMKLSKGIKAPQVTVRAGLTDPDESPEEVDKHVAGAQHSIEFNGSGLSLAAVQPVRSPFTTGAPKFDYEVGVTTYLGEIPNVSSNYSSTQEKPVYSFGHNLW